MRTLEYAKAQWENPELRETARRMKMEMDRQFDVERDNGYNISYDPNYLPGRYDGDTWQPGGVVFGGKRVIGHQFRGRCKIHRTCIMPASAGHIRPALTGQAWWVPACAGDALGHAPHVVGQPEGDVKATTASRWPWKES